ncbi:MULTISPECIES: hypothetical protein [unclassified Bradyrhizobium]
MSDDGMKAMAAAVLVLALLLWNGVIVLGTAYIVFGLGFSGWWWLLAIVLMSGSASAKS